MLPGPSRAASAGGGQHIAAQQTELSSAWKDQAKTSEELRSFGMFHPTWELRAYQGMQLAVASEVWPTSGESYIDVHGYVYNEHFREWRRFLVAKTRHAGHVRIDLDAAAGLLRVVGAANNELRGKALVTWDLRAVGNDAHR